MWRVPPQVRMVNNQIHQVHIADGFADDCEELIHRWLKSDLFTYETFCEIWKDMQFDSIFHGRSTGAEIAELSEEVINIAKHYMVSNPDNFEESVAGLFLVYALINLQPYAGFAPLRIVPEDVSAITHIEMVARRTRRYDVLYVLGSVLSRGPVQYHAAARERGMEASIRKYLDGTTGIDRVGVRPKGVFYRQNEELDLLRELNNITRRYVEAKKNIPDSTKSLNYLNEKFATDLDSSLKGIINGILEEGIEGNKKISDHYNTVQAIKEKAMKQSVDSVKFLSTSSARIAADAEKKKAAEARKLKGDVKSESTKKQVSPKKVSNKRRCTLRANAYKHQRKRKRAKHNWSSSSESDVSVDLTQDEDEDSQPSDPDMDEIDLNPDVNKPKTPVKSLEPIEEKEVDIASLPVFIRSEQDGSLLEIEIADKVTGAKPLAQIEVVEVPVENGEVAEQGKNGEVVVPAQNEEVAVLSNKNGEVIMPANNEEAVITSKNGGVGQIGVLSGKNGKVSKPTKTVTSKKKWDDMAVISKVNDSKDTKNSKELNCNNAELSNEKKEQRNKIKPRKKTHIEKIDPTLRRSTRRSIENKK